MDGNNLMLTGNKGGDIVRHMSSPRVFDYQDTRAFLLDVLSEKQRIEPAFSIRKWAKEMGLGNHTLLLFMLQGKRSIKVKHCEFLQRSLNLEEKELQYLKALVQYNQAKTGEEKAFFSKVLAEFRPSDSVPFKEINDLTILSDWLHMAILAATEMKNFSGSEAELVELFQETASRAKVRASILRLLQADLLAKDENFKLFATHKRISTRDDIASEGVKEYHQQTSELAHKAIREQNVIEREFQSFTMSVAPDKITLAKKMIREFRAELSTKVSGDGDFLYQTNIQFFRLTKRPTPASEDSVVAMDQTKEI